MKSPIHILLLDDDPMSNLINEKIFQFSGYDLKISSFVDAKEALNFLRTIIKFEDEKFPDIIFADINMNGMSGWEFIVRCTCLLLRSISRTLRKLKLMRSLKTLFQSH